MADNMSREGNHGITSDSGTRFQTMPQGSDGIKAPRSIRKLTVELDCSETLTGLKALQREARKATQAIRELEAERETDHAEFWKLFEHMQSLAVKGDDLTYRISQANDLVGTQGSDGNWNYNDYMHGMYNGMEVVAATIEGREPAFKDAPDEWIADKEPDNRPQVSELESYYETDGKRLFTQWTQDGNGEVSDIRTQDLSAIPTDVLVRELAKRDELFEDYSRVLGGDGE